MKRALILAAAAVIVLPAMPALAGDRDDSGYYYSGGYSPYDDYDPYYGSYDDGYYDHGGSGSGYNRSKRPSGYYGSGAYGHYPGYRARNGYKKSGQQGVSQGR